MAERDCSTSGRPRIWHWFLWTACVFVYFSVLRLSGDRDFGPQFRLLLAFNAVFFGAMLAGALILAARAITGEWRASISAPCHWLLLAYGISHVLEFIVGLTLWSALGDSEEYVPHFAFAWALSQMGAMGVYLLAAYSLSDRKLWRSFYIVQALVPLAVLAWAMLYWFGYAEYWLTNLPNVLAIPAVVLLVMSAVTDVRQGRRYDWIHWLGFFSHIALNAASLYWNIIGWRFDPPLAPE